MTDTLAIFTMMFWALVPLFWIPVHGFSGFFKKLGVFTYVMPAVTWLPVAALIYINRDFLLRYRTNIPVIAKMTGWLIFTLGMLLQIWTIRLLRVWGIMGLPEVVKMAESRIITAGPFSVVRHPTYLSHTIMYAGVFLITGAISLGVITLLDIVIVNTVVIPLEDRELVERFGNEYSKYKKQVPAFFPRWPAR